MRRRMGTIGTRSRTDMVSFLCGSGEREGGGEDVFFFFKSSKGFVDVTYCSDARRASVAVWGSLKERPSLLKGTCVSPRHVN